MMLISSKCGDANMAYLVVAVHRVEVR